MGDCVESWKITILIVSLLLGLSGISLSLNYIFKEKRRKRIHEIIKNFFKEEEISWHHGKDIYQIEINAKDNIYLIKIVLIGFQSELIITNPTYWCINNDPGEWRRSSKPKLVPSAKTFLEYQTNLSKPITKIALIYPGVNNISRYLNESDVELVNYRKAVNGILFVRLSELKDFFAGQD